MQSAEKAQIGGRGRIVFSAPQLSQGKSTWVGSSRFPSPNRTIIFN